MKKSRKIEKIDWKKKYEDAQSDANELSQRLIKAERHRDV